MTIKDIAKEAGVSIATVSNVIHGVKSHVSPEVRDKINQIIKENHYTPNLSARALSSKSSRIIGFINIADISGSLSEDPFLSLIIRIIEQELSASNYYMMFKTVSTYKEILEVYKNWNMAGIVIMGDYDLKLFKEISKLDIPCVLLDSYYNDGTHYNVGLEDFEGGYIATRYLIEKGHRNIAFGSPTIHSTGVVHERYMGYRKALSEAGIAFDEQNVFQVSAVSNGKQIAEWLLERKSVTAIFCTADLIAATIIDELEQHGVKVPDDVSVIGFDDTYISSLMRPKLTTVHQDFLAKGKAVVNTLLNILNQVDTERNVILPVSITERDSVKSL